MSKNRTSISSIILHRILRFWRWLISPNKPYEDIEMQHKSRLLAGFIITLVIIFTGVMIYYMIRFPGNRPPLYRYVLLLVAFLLNHYSRYRLAAILVVAIFPLVILINIYTGVEGNFGPSLRYLIVSLVLASVFLENFSTLVLTLINSIGIVLIPVLMPQLGISFASLVFPLTTNMVAGPMLVMMKHHRDRIERDKQVVQSETDARLRSIFENSPLGITVISPTTQILDANPKFSQMVGYSKTELLTMTMIEMTHPVDAATTGQFIHRTLAENNDTYSLEQRLVKKDGEALWINFIGNIIRNEKGEIAFGVGLSEDITNRKKSAQALQESIQTLQGFMEQSTDGITIVDQHGQVNKWSQGMEKMSGIPSNQAVGRNAWDLQMQMALPHRKTEEMREVYKSINEKVIKTGAIDPNYQRMETDFINTSGERRSMQIVTFPIKTDAGNLVGSIHRDITERNRSEEILRKSTHELQEAQRIAKLGSWSNNVATGEITWSDQVYRIFGYEPNSELSPNEIFERHIHPDDRDAYLELIKSYFEDADMIEFKNLPMRIIATDGEIKFLTTSGEHFANPQGERIGARGTILDITERQRIQEQLERYTSELARSNEELQQFAYIASHDLQEPLRKIQAFGDRLKSKYAGTLDERGQDFIIRMQDAAVRGQNMIEALLAYSRITTQGREFVLTDLNQVVDDVLTDLEIRIDDCHGTIRVEKLPKVAADPNQMHQLFQNLISNSLKFHAPDQSPSVEITCSKLSAKRVQIIVKDDGIGFDGTYANRIFQPFQRLHTRTEYEGSGIGLAVCRKIVERHRGEISVQSKPGEGATFLIALPVGIEGRSDNQV